MKRVLITLVLVTLLVGLLPFSASLAENYVSVYSGNQYGVRLREGPGTGYTSIMTVPNGTTMVLLESGTIWSRVSAGTTTGYMMSKYLLGAGTSSSVVATESATVYSDNGLRVWLRTSENGKRIGLYSPGTPVSVISRGDTWSRVMIGSSVGYMMTEFLKFPEPTPVPPVQQLTAVSLNYVYPLVGDTLTPVTVPADATVTYKWERIDQEGKVVQSVGNSGGYAVVATDKNYSIKVTVTGTGLYTGSVSFTSNVVTDSRAITGVQISTNEPVVGDVLTAVMAPSSATVTYSWRVNGTEKGTEASYTVTADDAGKTIQVQVTATGSYTGSASSQLTQTVTTATTIKSVKLNSTIPVVGNTLSAVITPSNASASYVWYVDEQPVAYTSTYVVSSVDLGYKIKVKVTGSGSYSGTATSESTRLVAQALVTAVTLDKTSPVVGDTITASVTPSNATVKWEWYRAEPDDVENTTEKVDNNNSSPNKLTIPQEEEGYIFFARAIPTGIFGTSSTTSKDGVYYLDSARTKAVASKWELTAVTLDDAYPVVGEKITATVTPAIKAETDELTYLWYQEGTVVQVTSTNTYIVNPDDAGKRLRVRVNGGGGYIGSVTSSFTTAVTTARDLSGVSIYNETTKLYTSASQPRVGQTLRADPNPIQAADGFVTYQWTLNGVNIDGATSRTLAVTDAMKGKTIGVIITGNLTTTPNSGNGYKGTKSTSAPAVLNTQGLTISIPDNVIPVANQYPKTSYSGEHYKCTNITWTPELNENGTFKPNETYTAVFTFTFDSGYSLDESTVQANSGTFVGSNNVAATVEWSFSTATEEQLVTLYNISGIDTPVVGATPADTIDSTTQYTGSVTWEPNHSVFESGEPYTATITLNLKDGYKLDSNMEGTGAFRVENATSTVIESYNADSSPKTVTIKAAFGAMNNIVTVTGTKAEASAGQTVQYVAKVSNYLGDQDMLPWVWSVTGNTSPNTKIDSESGTLIIGEDETAGKALTITGKVQLIGETEISGKATLQVVAATETPTGEVFVTFLRFPNSLTLTANEDGSAPTVQFAAVAENATNEGVNWSISGNKSKDTVISSSGKLTVALNETSSKITVTAKAQVDTSKFAVYELTIIQKEQEPAYLEFTNVYSSVKPGDTATFVVELFNADIATVGAIKAATDATYVESFVIDDGVITLKVKDTAPIDTTIRIFAYCEIDDSISTRCSFKVTSTSQVQQSATNSISLTSLEAPVANTAVTTTTTEEQTKTTTTESETPTELTGEAEENKTGEATTKPTETTTTTTTQALNMMD